MMSKDLRFKFGENWLGYVSNVDEKIIEVAKESLISLFGVSNLNGATFIDIGSGSGLFSLSARMLGANVISFDYDLKSVECTRLLKNRFYPNDKNWEILQGSILDVDFLKTLGKFDYVYSWGVLHHTGSMWNAIRNLEYVYHDNSKICIAIYNDQGALSKFWTFIKMAYCSNIFYRLLIKVLFIPYFATRKFFGAIMLGSNPLDLSINYREQRGMSIYYDWLDWLGGYPFEVATPDEVIEYFIKLGFTLQKLKTCGGSLGCNEYVFQANR